MRGIQAIGPTPNRQGWWDITLTCGHRFALLCGPRLELEGPIACKWCRDEGYEVVDEALSAADSDYLSAIARIEKLAAAMEREVETRGKLLVDLSIAQREVFQMILTDLRASA
jgi:hypothetical protein